jgi:Fur family zinc uptake transcriptional regulator
MSYCGISIHRHSPESIVAQIESTCSARGLNLTPLRRRVLELIALHRMPVKAYDLLDQLKDVHDGAAPPTVYRALDFLLQHGFVHKLESCNAYVLCPHPGQQHASHFLICDACGITVELEDAALVERLEEQARLQGFTPRQQVIEIHGRCAECAKSA